MKKVHWGKVYNPKYISSEIYEKIIMTKTKTFVFGDLRHSVRCKTRIGIYKKRESIL